ncbi:MAG: hypothetical protein AAB648_01780 [Patescibacteria group bacterium]
MKLASNGNARDKAVKALKVELNKQGFETSYPPDTSSEKYRVGAEIWVPMPAKFTDEDRHRDFKKISDITKRIAGDFSLLAVTGVPVSLENDLYFVCCGFQRGPITK